ncbi:MAG TPA: helix-turn-helix domain-containing protein [Methanomassiliicoccales archaeon]|nr:helix-turn-helix domain-containing protein [Methanomassiliicoccales archaeon]
MRFPSESEIKRLRKSLDITQLELARLSGVSQSTIAKLERGV